MFIYVDLVIMYFKGEDLDINIFVFFRGWFCGFFCVDVFLGFLDNKFCLIYLRGVWFLD